MNEKTDFKIIKDIIRRRRKSFLFSFLGIFIISIIIALFWPSTYRATSTILIENQMIPEEYVQTTITSFVEERLAAITQQIMSRSRLLEIIKNYNLYQEMTDRYTTEEIVDKMKNDITFEPKTANVIDRRTGKATEATIYFTLSYEGKEQAKVEKVANTLASLYLELNLKSREELASNTTGFLDNQLSELREQVNGFEQSISEFKKIHMGELPEYNSINIQTLQQLKAQLDTIDIQINSLEERKILLQGQLAGLDPLMSVITEDGKAVMNPSDRLKYLRMELISAGSKMSKDHPDYIKLKKEIVELEKQTASVEDGNVRIKKLNELETKLAEANGKMGEKHPDIINLKKEIAALQKEIEEGKAKKTVQSASGIENPDNPAYINIKTQIASADMDIQGFKERKKNIEGQIVFYQQKLAAAPAVEQEYNELQLDYQTARAKYAEISNKLMEAKVSQGMEETQRGERFTIIDPAQFPEKPSNPNRLAILIIGFVLALGAGIGIAAVKETVDRSVKTSEEMISITGVPVLSSIDLIVTGYEKRARMIRKITWAIAIIAGIVIGMLVFNSFIMPIDVVGAKIERRINRIQPM